MDRESGAFLGYDEKPTYTHFIGVGLYGMKPQAVRPFLDGRHLDMPDLVRKMKAGGRQISCFRDPCVWLDIGRPEDYRLANEIYETRSAEFLAGSL